METGMIKIDFFLCLKNTMKQYIIIALVIIDAIILHQIYNSLPDEKKLHAEMNEKIRKYERTTSLALADIHKQVILEYHRFYRRAVIRWLYEDYGIDFIIYFMHNPDIKPYVRRYFINMDPYIKRFYLKKAGSRVIIADWMRNIEMYFKG
jgi:hypothetical protein